MMISELGHTTHSRHVENPYLGFLFRCYSDPKSEVLENTVQGDGDAVWASQVGGETFLRVGGFGNTERGIRF